MFRSKNKWSVASINIKVGGKCMISLKLQQLRVCTDKCGTKEFCINMPKHLSNKWVTEMEGSQKKKYKWPAMT